MSQRRSKRQPLDFKKMKNHRTPKALNVMVAVRVRPLNETEKERGEQSMVFCPDKHNLQVSQPGGGRCFSFDAALGPDTSQEDLFETCRVKSLVDMVTQGHSCTVFAFGQTGSGKTYTISGPHSVLQGAPYSPPSPGLVHRCLSHLLQVCSPGEGVTLHASYLEVYNEQVRDLLHPVFEVQLAVRGSKTHGFRAENPTLMELRSLDDLTKLLSEGQGKRHTSSHQLNEQSSRGHAILTVYIRSQSVGVAGGGASQGKLSLVDLAGSERVKLTGCEAGHLEEAGNINRSLLSLGKCIAALVVARGRDRHIPYRDSKLTKLLSDSLGGAGYTLMIACVSPTASSLPETLNTLYYSSQARRIRPRTSANQGQRERLVTSLRREIRLLHKENLLLRQRLSAFQEARRPELGVKHAGSGSSETLTVEGAGSSRPGSASCSETSLLQELDQEKDKLQQDVVELPGRQESSSQQRELSPEKNTQLLDPLQDLKRVITTLPTPPPPRDSAPSRISSPYCPHSHAPSFLPPIRAQESSFYCPWRPLLYTLCPAGYCLPGLVQSCTLPYLCPCEPFPHLRESCLTKRHRQGELSPLPAPGSDGSARNRADRHSWEADPGSVRPRGTRPQSDCLGFTRSFRANSNSQQATAMRPRPPSSEVRVAPSAPPLPKQPRPLQLVVAERRVAAEHAQAV